MSARWIAGAFALATLASGARAGAQEDPVHDDPYPRPAHFFLRAEGGATYRSLYGIDVGAGNMSIGAGADTRAGSFGGGLWGVFGSTEEGLGMRQWGLQGEAAWMVGDRVRLGVMPRIGFLELDRFTQGGAAESVTGGFAGRIGVDLVRESGFALAIGVEPAFDSTLQLSFGEGKGTGLFLPSIGTFLQVRYRFARRPLEPAPPIPPTVPFGSAVVAPLDHPRRRPSPPAILQPPR